MTTLVRQDYLDDAAAWRTYHLRQAVINADNEVAKATTAVMQAGIDEIEEAYVAFEIKRKELIQVKEMEADYHKRMREIIDPPLIPVRQDTGD